jgi:hypothetical protein
MIVTAQGVGAMSTSITAPSQGAAVTVTTSRAIIPVPAAIVVKIAIQQEPGTDNLRLWPGDISKWEEI